MAEPISRLIYGSENRLQGSGPELNAAVGEIMEASRRNNRACGLTGALLFTGSHFTQVLEGRRAEVERTFERISQDFRHGEVMLIGVQEISQRAFASWSMTLLDARRWPSADHRRFAGLAPTTVEDHAGEAIVELLQRFLVKRAPDRS